MLSTYEYFIIVLLSLLFRKTFRFMNLENRKNNTPDQQQRLIYSFICFDLQFGNTKKITLNTLFFDVFNQLECFMLLNVFFFLLSFVPFIRSVLLVLFIFVSSYFVSSFTRVEEMNR